ncbi:MAG: FKBP-type peptidyl-prolyl cis-trans isomerase [Candidatus Nomurabacteria bacterium]|nr:FKBP-type peptidyl-prolyl cis-trans isomerase [Candidatus Nomurabacteria bacterium]
MQKQKGNMGVVVSFIIVIGLIVLAVYSLMHRPVKVDPLEGIKGVDSSAPTTAGDSATATTGEQQAQPTEQKTMEPNTNANKNVRNLSNFTPVAKVSTLEKIDQVVGTGKEVQAGATVSVHYTGAVAATGAIFQSSKDFGTEPVTFPLSGVIKGWTDGIPGMKIGGTRRLVIPAAMAYGANPPSGSGIPANADLVFDVELVAIK